MRAHIVGRHLLQGATTTFSCVWPREEPHHGEGQSSNHVDTREGRTRRPSQIASLILIGGRGAEERVVQALGRVDPQLPTAASAADRRGSEHEHPGDRETRGWRWFRDAEVSACSASPRAPSSEALASGDTNGNPSGRTHGWASSAPARRGGEPGRRRERDVQRAQSGSRGPSPSLTARARTCWCTSAATSDLVERTSGDRNRRRCPRGVREAPGARAPWYFRAADCSSTPRAAPESRVKSKKAIKEVLEYFYAGAGGGSGRQAEQREKRENGEQGEARTGRAVRRRAVRGDERCRRWSSCESSITALQKVYVASYYRIPHYCS